MEALPLVVIGAGPAGLAAAANAQQRGVPAVVLEAGGEAGAGVREWGHVRLFSQWSELVDPAAEKVLTPTGWAAPEPSAYPTGRDWATGYLQPLADALGATDEVTVRYEARVVGVTRQGRDLVVDSGREAEPFVLQVQTATGVERVVARAVIDASGTSGGPNPLGGDGLPAIGEGAARQRITYRVPDLRAQAVRSRYAGRHVVVAGTGASSQNALVELAALAKEAPGTRVSWLVRRSSAKGAFGGGDNDQLVARGALGTRAREAVESGAVTAVTGFRTSEVAIGEGGRLSLTSFDGQQVTDVDEVIAVTGFRPDMSMLSEVRLDLDPVLQAPRALAPLIDPNVHSCGTVYPHGAKELAQPEAGFYLVGMKSYGRAPSFLALTGYEQVRSVVAAIDGDHEAAERVELTLPESGVCGGSGLFDEPEQTDAQAGGCCGAPASEALLTIGTAPPR
ncbi:NAD(P)-binding domain-containing protein [Luteipulveratus halotolerans]|uniref:Flavoprotein n=1 Tax=Luteipulveratus halotolerans TaxID=1631356 RepID=A0A0L6CKQ4_9MICO|nr:NAD(P)-binding domain-containing protein [Luteipulveratus halotolerans]KNX38381.1 flavoprotein [Luteipulveratus halotolerans]